MHSNCLNFWSEFDRAHKRHQTRYAEGTARRGGCCWANIRGASLSTTGTLNCDSVFGDPAGTLNIDDIFGRRKSGDVRDCKVRIHSSVPESVGSAASSSDGRDTLTFTGIADSLSHRLNRAGYHNRHYCRSGFREIQHTLEVFTVARHNNLIEKM
jgi:hypothetical protein